MGCDRYGEIVRKLNRLMYFGNRDNHCIKLVTGNCTSAKRTIKYSSNNISKFIRTATEKPCRYMVTPSGSELNFT